MESSQLSEKKKKKRQAKRNEVQFMAEHKDFYKVLLMGTFLVQHSYLLLKLHKNKWN